jgi:hypothetical protein
LLAEFIRLRYPENRATVSLRFENEYQDAVHSVRTQAAAQGKTARPGFVTELQDRSGMGGLEFFAELEHVIVFPADDPITDWQQQVSSPIPA